MEKKDDSVWSAFLAMQKEMPVIPKSRDGYNFKYAPYEQIAKIAFPVMWRHGFVIHHECVTVTEGRSCVRTCLTHADTGTELVSFYDLDAKMKDQDRGKSLTYGKRYNTALLLGLSIEGEPDRDDDHPKSEGSNEDF